MTTFYVKRGRRYVPVAEHGEWPRMAHGFHLVEVRPGFVASRAVDPALAELMAAARITESAMVAAMVARCLPDEPRNVTEADPKDQARYQLAWDAWRTIVGPEPMHFRGVSMVDVVRAGVDALVLAARAALPVDVDSAEVARATPRHPPPGAMLSAWTTSDRRERAR